MFFVLPKWQAYNVEDWQSLIVETEDGCKGLKDATATLLNYMAIIGIDELTNENLEDAWHRIAIHQAIFGCINYDELKRKPMFLTRTDVERHIGVEVETDNITFQEFCSKIKSLKLDSPLSELPSYIANGNSTMLELCC